MCALGTPHIKLLACWFFWDTAHALPNSHKGLRLRSAVQSSCRRNTLPVTPFSRLELLSATASKQPTPFAARPVGKTGKKNKPKRPAPSPEVAGGEPASPGSRLDAASAAAPAMAAPQTEAALPDVVASPPPRSCPSAVGCLYPDHIYLMSATVRGGDLYVMSLDAFPENWRQAGNSLRRIRGTFEVRTRRDDPQGGAATGAGEDANWRTRRPTPERAGSAERVRSYRIVGWSFERGTAHTSPLKKTRKVSSPDPPVPRARRPGGCRARTAGGLVPSACKDLAS